MFNLPPCSPLAALCCTRGSALPCASTPLPFPPDAAAGPPLPAPKLAGCCCCCCLGASKFGGGAMLVGSAVCLGWASASALPCLFLGFLVSSSRGSSWQRCPILRLTHRVHGLSCPQRQHATSPRCRGRGWCEDAVARSGQRGLPKRSYIRDRRSCAKATEIDRSATELQTRQL